MRSDLPDSGGQLGGFDFFVNELKDLLLFFGKNLPIIHEENITTHLCGCQEKFIFLGDKFKKGIPSEKIRSYFSFA